VDSNDPLHHQNATEIPVGNGQFAIVDKAWAPALCLFDWYTVRHRRCYYAYARIHFKEYDGKMSMSRIVAQTPTNQVCHHRNRNPLDNRHGNLLNMDRKDHQHLHRNNTLLIKHVLTCPYQSLV
jgi:hypothetical protein